MIALFLNFNLFCSLPCKSYNITFSTEIRVRCLGLFTAEESEYTKKSEASGLSTLFKYPKSSLSTDELFTDQWLSICGKLFCITMWKSVFRYFHWHFQCGPGQKTEISAYSPGLIPALAARQCAGLFLWMLCSSTRDVRNKALSHLICLKGHVTVHICALVY